MGERHGVAAALAEDGGTEPGRDLRQLVEAEPDQGQLFAEALADEVGEVEKPFGLTLPGRGPGRPRNKRNLSTEQTKRLIRAVGGDPHMAAARIVAGGPAFVMKLAAASFADAAGKDDTGGAGPALEPKDAMSLWMRAVEFLGPYMMAKEAQKLEIDHDGQPIQIVLPVGVQIAAPDIGGSAEARRGGWTLPEDDKSSTYDQSEGASHTGASHTGGDDD